MMLSSYHTHSKYSDGKNTLEEMVQSAIEMGCEEIGFSDHAPMTIECEWCMNEKDVPSYKNEILALKEKYKDKIKIYVGVEQDYYSTPAQGYDYILGSVHYVCKNGEYLPVDLSGKAMEDFVNKHYNGDVYSYCEDYFKLVKDIYNKTKCQIIGHFDLVTKFNETHPMIDINHPRYVKAIDDAIGELLKSPAIFEINTGAISRGYRTTPYPDEPTIDKIAKSGKSFVITPDTHNKDTITFNFKEQQAYLDKKGYSYIKSLEEIINK